MPIRRIVGRWSVALGASLLSGCLGCGRETAPPGPFELADPSAFSGHPGEHRHPPFDVVVADADLDGNTDVLINWHHLGPLELFENEAGRFTLVNAPGRDAGGLWDNRGIPSLFAPLWEMGFRIGYWGQPGLYVWHDVERDGRWRFVWMDKERRYRGLELDLETTSRVLDVDEVATHELEQLDDRRLHVSIDANARAAGFGVQTHLVGVQLKLRARTGAGAPAPIFVGPEAIPYRDGNLDVWKADPHGIAWVNVEGDPRPELYVTRGGVQGQVRPPGDPKVDRYYLPVPNEQLAYRLAAPEVVPADYSRGRRVEWVDVDNDGVLELSIASHATPNRLLVRHPTTGTFEDRASAYGLDLPGAEVQCWGDFDGDGFQDLYYLQEDAVNVARNRAGASFEVLDGAKLGLQLPPLEAARKPLFETTALRLVDFDDDGALDLWVLGYGPQGTSHLFRREADHFTDVSSQVGLDAVARVENVVFLDVDNDGFEDAVSFGTEPELPFAPQLRRWSRRWLGPRAMSILPPNGEATLWHNVDGARFEFMRLSRALVPERVYAATSLDADGDGSQDLVVVGLQRSLLLNGATHGNGFLDVSLRDGPSEPIGAVVRVFYPDGRVAARRYGSVASSAFSQGSAPLHFGVPAGTAVKKIGVLWPGHTIEHLHDLTGANGTIVIERRTVASGFHRE